MTPTATLPATQSLSKRSVRGLLDAALLCLLLFGVYAKTPLGAIAETSVRVALGQKERPSLFASFRGHETSVQLTVPQLETGLLASTTFPEAILAAAKRTDIDPELLVSLVGASGACDASGCQMKTPPQLGSILDSLDQLEHTEVLPVAIALALAKEKLGDVELAVEALYVGIPSAMRARDQAAATGLDFPEAAETHASFYSPMQRRGVLQEALAVLALHRLRTLAWPADGRFRVSSPFGYRIHPVLGTKRFHNGVDLATPTGTPLLSPAKGKVSRASRDSVSGNYVKLSLGFGIESTFCHMSLLDVTTGARVKRKERVGLSGATGRVTGPHLHYILRIAGKAVDPEKYGFAPARKRDRNAAKSVAPPLLPPNGAAKNGAAKNGAAKNGAAKNGAAKNGAAHATTRKAAHQAPSSSSSVREPTKPTTTSHGIASSVDAGHPPKKRALDGGAPPGPVGAGTPAVAVPHAVPVPPADAGTAASPPVHADTDRSDGGAG